MIPIESATPGRHYKTPRGVRVRLVGKGSMPGSFNVETDTGRSFVMEEGQLLHEIDEETTTTVPTNAAELEAALGACVALNRVGLSEALPSLTDADLDVVLSRHPSLWVVGAVSAERKRRAGEKPDQAFEEVTPDRGITCPECGEKADARLMRGIWIVVTHAAGSEPVCTGSGRVVETTTEEAPAPRDTVKLRAGQIHDLDTMQAIHDFRRALEGDETITPADEEELDTQARMIGEGVVWTERAKAGDVDAIRKLAEWSWASSGAFKARPGIQRAFSTEAAWAAAELKRIADEAELEIARAEAARKREERILGEDPERVDRALDTETPDPAIRARVDKLRAGVRGAREAARIETDPAIVERALEEERQGGSPTIVQILEARLAALRGERRRNVKAATATPAAEIAPQEEPTEALQVNHAAIAEAARLLAARPRPSLAAQLPKVSLGRALELVAEAESAEDLLAARDAESEGSGAPCRTRVLDAIAERLVALAGGPQEPQEPQVGTTAPPEASGAAPAPDAEALDPEAPLAEDGTVPGAGRPVLSVTPEAEKAAADIARKLAEARTVAATPLADEEIRIPETARLLILVPGPEGEELWAELADGRKVHVGPSTHPNLREAAAAVRRSVMRQTQTPAPRASKVAHALHALADAVLEATELGIVLTVTISTPSKREG